MLELTGDHVARLGDEDLRLLVAKLCEAELRRAHQPSSSLLAGGNQTAKDGGIDVRVQLEGACDALDFIPRAHTGFQVKCEDMPAREIGKEMRPDGDLRESIRELIDRKGAYIIVSSKGTVADAFLRKRLQAMRDAAADQPCADDLKLDFYDRDRLARWVRQYPGVEMWLRLRIDARLQGWQGYGAWAGGEPDAPYLLDETARLVERTGGGTATPITASAGLDKLRTALSKPGQVLRIVGLSGTGKTRLVQALFEKGVGSTDPLDTASALYTDIGHAPEPNAREMLLNLGAVGQRAIVIVDNCNPSTHRILADVVRQHKQHLSLLTVEYDVVDEDSPDATDVYELAPASDQVLDDILARLAPHLTSPDRRRITEFSGGNARVGLALARTVNKGETLGVLTDEELFRRLFKQGQAESAELLRAAEVLSLVYSFEGEDTTSEDSELRVLAMLAGMTASELYRHVDSLRRRDLVQARSKWRAVLPPALANRLAKSALRSIPRADILETFESRERLLISFSRRLEYLHDSEDACALAGRWIEDENWLARPAELNSLGRNLFFNLAPLVPGKVLSAMERALSPSEVTDFVARQKDALHAWSTLLRHLAYEVVSFNRAASLLLCLAEQEEGGIVDCRRAWKELFRIGLSGTLASPTQRVQFLDQLLRTSTGNREELVWAAVESMLEANHISSSHDFSFGARPHSYGWQPSSNDEVFSWFESAFALLRRIAGAGPKGREYVRDALARHFRELWGCGVDAQVTTLVHEISGGDGWPTGWVAVRSALRFDGEHLPAESLSALKILEVALAPKGLLQEIRAYTAGHAAGHLDVSDFLDESDEAEEKNSVSALQRVCDKVVDLGVAAAQDDSVLRQVLPDLFVDQWGRKNFFGMGLAKGSPDPRHHWKLLAEAFSVAPEPKDVLVLTGFIGGLRGIDPTVAAEILDRLPGDSKLDMYFPRILGLPYDDDDGDRLIAAAKRGVTQANMYTLRTKQSDEDWGLSVAKFCDAMMAISDMEGGLIKAIDELGMELYQLKTRNAVVPPEILSLGRALLARFNFDSGNANLVWRINELAKAVFSGEEAVEATEKFASRFAIALDDYRTHGDQYGELACTLFRLQPQIALDAILSKPVKRRHLGFRARFVMRHGPVVQCAPEKAIVDWVLAAPEVRAPLVAAEIDIVDVKTEGGLQLSALARQLLSLSPGKLPVLKALSQHFQPSHWSGSLAHTLAPYIGLLEGLTGSSDSVIASWAQENLKSMRLRIEQDRRLEIRQEQSFE